METKVIQKIRVLCDDDEAVIDFLADLQDKGCIRSLQRYVYMANNGSVCLLYKCSPDNLVLIILFKAPIGFNSEKNNLIVFIHNDLDFLVRYFKQWIDNTSKSNPEVYGALDDILRLLYIEWAKTQDKSVNANFQG